MFTEPEVELLSITSNAEALIARAARTCYNSFDLSTPESDAKLIANAVRRGHESVLEHASATFRIVASRVLTHELVRHRLASYSQRSQRYVRETEPEYLMPPEVVAAGGHALGLYQQAMELAWQAYEGLLEYGLPKQIARYVLPNACGTEIVVTANFREWRHIVRLRGSKAAQPEIRVMAAKALRVLQNEAPNVFGDLAIEEPVHA